jgi:hypothetical protein
MLKQAIVLSIIIMALLVGCEKPEPFTYDESRYRGEAVASTGDTLIFGTTFTLSPNERSGLYTINVSFHSTGKVNLPPILCSFKIADLSVGCKVLRFAPGVSVSYIEYPHMIAKIIDGDQILGRYMLREDQESQICIDEVLRDGKEIKGTFEVYMYRERASFPWLETNWPDSLYAVTEGQFLSFGYP